MSLLLRFHYLPLAGLCAIALLVVYVGDRWLKKIENSAGRFATHQGTVIVAAVLASILGRVALLPVVPVPVPSAHDEFSYLLASDTFAHGRLTNPQHPLWIFFETFHVLQHPTYASMYPPAQGMMLAFGQLLGHPWIGVLLSIAAMCGAITWMLQGWLPARWALLGSVLVLFRLDLMSYWVDSYWGGAVAATGGALVAGALPRILRHQRMRDAFFMGLGAALLANSRPLEGLVFCLPVGVALIAWIFSRKYVGLRWTVGKTLLPAVCLLGVAVIFMGYYNWRVTGDALLPPHVLDDRQSTNFPVFVWQKLKPPLTYLNPQFDFFYNVWQPTFYHRPWLRLTLSKLRIAWEFFVGIALTIPLLAVPWGLLDRKIRFLLLQSLWCGLGLLSVVWFEPHYVAPLVAALVALLVQAWRHLRRWKFLGRPVGIFATRLVFVLALAEPFLPIERNVRDPVYAWSLRRAAIARQLETTPGRHLVLVHYRPDHDPQYEWVYNAANIDQAKVVWAREIPGQDPKRVLDYYPDREVWELEADRVPARLHGYEASGGPKTR